LLQGFGEQALEDLLGPKILRPAASPGITLSAITPSPVIKQMKVEWTAMNTAKSLEEL
jgi:hypothetical protein